MYYDDSSTSPTMCTRNTSRIRSDFKNISKNKNYKLLRFVVLFISPRRVFHTRRKYVITSCVAAVAAPHASFGYIIDGRAYLLNKQPIEGTIS